MDLTFEAWEALVPEALRKDTLWRMRVYRLALYTADLGWPDITRLAQDRRTVSVSDQLFRALGSIGSNIAEGYSRSSGRDRTRFYEYALGSAREARDWYFKSRHILGESVAIARMNHQSEIIRLLLAMLPNERTLRLGEPVSPPYEVD